jgi:hypothetical protein
LPCRTFGRARAVWPRGVREAYIDQHEFCHLHPPPEGTIHLTLPQPVHRQVVELGWGEPHPMAGSGLSPNLVLIYGPRDVEELEIVLGLVVICRSFATGAIGLPAAALA